MRDAKYGKAVKDGGADLYLRDLSVKVARSKTLPKE